MLLVGKDLFSSANPAQGLPPGDGGHRNDGQSAQDKGDPVELSSREFRRSPLAVHDDRGIDHDEEDEGAGHSPDDDHDARSLEDKGENTPDGREDEGAGSQEFLAAVRILEIPPSQLAEGIAEEAGPGGEGGEEGGKEDHQRAPRKIPNAQGPRDSV